MIVVLDVSAAFSLILNGKGNEVLRRYVQEADLVLAPNLYIAEATNTAWKYHHLREVPFDDVKKMVELSLELIDEFVDEEASWRHALVLSCDNGHAVYDCLYLHLAQQRQATLLTLDKRLASLAIKLKVAVIT